MQTGISCDFRVWCERDVLWWILHAAAVVCCWIYTEDVCRLLSSHMHNDSVTLPFSHSFTVISGCTDGGQKHWCLSGHYIGTIHLMKTLHREMSGSRLTPKSKLRFWILCEETEPVFRTMRFFLHGDPKYFIIILTKMKYYCKVHIRSSLYFLLVLLLLRENDS